MFHLRNPAYRILWKRCFHSSQKSFINPKNVEEVRIPVPWGHIAGRWWGEKETLPVIALHGFSDNGATFDKLAPLLETPSLLSLDLPGHGFSSHVPPGVVLHYFDNLIWLRYIIKQHFKWDKLKLLGHSYGGSLWFLYSALYPTEVEKYISIDGATYNLATKEEKAAKYFRFVMDAHLQLEKKLAEEPIQEGNFEDLVKIMYDIRKKKLPLSKEACVTLMTRGVKKSSSGKYYFTRDLRLNSKAIGALTVDFIYALSECIKSDVLYINASKTIMVGEWLQTSEKSLGLMKKSAKSVKQITVEGSHHVHLENPERVAPAINEFLSS